MYIFTFFLHIPSSKNIAVQFGIIVCTYLVDMFWVNSLFLLRKHMQRCIERICTFLFQNLHPASFQFPLRSITILSKWFRPVHVFYCQIL